MSELQQNTDSSPSLSNQADAVKIHALIAYVCMIAGLFTGIFWLIGGIWAMVKKGEAQGTIYESHFSNVILTFWLAIVFSIVGYILSLIYIGVILLFVVWIWSIYRIVKGLARATSNKAYNS